ncbi:ATP synthase subunit I [Ostreibacterium oceani]|uniref:ATP synthase subunit I n=1 Tax=Ostreibacterium oceani TaxID=2654998 RepID=A0A6N7F401_9GAMM|nr:ATP synthase subunit I [Ostreibacterium oceani]MPV86606.1 hypothetical protein [Ostreibacterium oceani]
MTNKSVLLVATLLIGVGFFLPDWHSQFSYYAGLSVSGMNAGLFFLFYFRVKQKISTYPSQAVVKVFSSTITRFAAVVALLALIFQLENVVAAWLMVGFMLGQCCFLLNQLNLLSVKHGEK